MLRMNAAPSLDDLSALYLLRCEVEGKSAQTVRAYRETLGRFRRVGTVDDAAAVTPEDVYRYLGGCSHLSLEMRHRYFREVRCFFNWLVDRRYLDANPFRGIKNVRLPQRIVEPFSPADIAQLMAACDSATALGLRDRAIVLCLLDTGLRCSELVQLSLVDLDLEARRLRVRYAKGNKQRVVPFAARCRAALERYLEQRGTTPGPLFVAANHLGALKPATALRPNGLKQMLRRLGRRTGMAKVHAHRFRQRDAPIGEACLGGTPPRHIDSRNPPRGLGSHRYGFGGTPHRSRQHQGRGRYWAPWLDCSVARSQRNSHPALRVRSCYRGCAVQVPLGWSHRPTVLQSHGRPRST